MSTSPIQDAEQLPDKWDLVGDLLCDLRIELPLPGFRVGDLMELASKSVLDAHWPVDKAVPLRVNGELLAWCEFELIANRLAVRLTELA